MNTHTARNENATDGSATRRVVACIVILAIAFASNAPLIYGQLSGDDEALQAWTCRKVLNNLEPWRGFGSLKDAALVLSYDSHPPLRYLITLPSVALFPTSAFALRFVSIFFSLLMTWQVMKLGRELGGESIAIASGLLVASSAVYNWTSLAFGWSIAVTMLIIALRELRLASLDVSDRGEISRLRKINLALIIAVLVNTTFILFFLMTFLIYALKKRRKPLATLKAFAPFIGFYAAYYCYFALFVPWYAHHVAGAVGPVGQFRHMIGRWEITRLNYESFIDNIKALNGHYVPFLAWLFFAGAAWHLITRERRLALWVAPFVLVWSFLMMWNTSQYFILASICVLPFGVKFMADHLRGKGFVAAAAVLIAACATWNFMLFVRPYGDAVYPEKVLKIGFAARGYRNNVVEPYAQIGHDLDRLLKPGEKFVEDLEGAFSLYYCRDNPRELFHARRAGRLGDKEFPATHDPGSSVYSLGFSRAKSKVRAVVTAKSLGPRQIQQTISYPHSKIRIYILRGQD